MKEIILWVIVLIAVVIIAIVGTIFLNNRRTTEEIQENGNAIQEREEDATTNAEIPRGQEEPTDEELRELFLDGSTLEELQNEIERWAEEYDEYESGYDLETGGIDG